MFRKILTPVDLSDRVVDVLEFAQRLAREHASSVTLFHVIEVVDVPFEELAEFYQELEAKARDRLEQLAQPLRDAGLDTEIAVAYGKRAREIVAYADQHDYDLVVIGSHRLTADTLHAGLMTISHQVAIAAQTPVLVVKR